MKEGAYRPVVPNAKTTQLQIRVSPGEKLAIQRAARRAGVDMSAYVLERVLGSHERRAAELMEKLATADQPSFVLAALNDLLSALGAGELRRAVAQPPPASLRPRNANYVAAMVEYACGRRGVEAPGWTRAIAPLAEPVFGSQLESLRLHLLASSPAPFRLRNIFIDTSIGGRV